MMKQGEGLKLFRIKNNGKPHQLTLKYILSSHMKVIAYEAFIEKEKIEILGQIRLKLKLSSGWFGQIKFKFVRPNY
jgi:hypothetical protein